MHWLKFSLIILLFGTNIVKANSTAGNQIFVPSVSSNNSYQLSQRSINIPYINEVDLDSKSYELAILWFGNVSQDENYADVRIGYNDTELFIRAQVIDRRLWYSEEPWTSPFEDWDSLAVTLNLDAYSSSLSQKTYRFIGQLRWVGNNPDYQKSFQGNGNTWSEKQLPVTVNASWRSIHNPNEDSDGHGWFITYQIPFSTIGLNTKPPEGTTIRLGFTLYDRDSAVLQSLTPKTWPENYNPQNPNTWGMVRFGLAGYSTPNIVNVQTTIVREGLNGVHVPDAMVGGSSTCGAGLEVWGEWGNTNYLGSTFMNIQNQADISEWPCFSKYFVNFPITNIPPGKVIKSARLSMHQFGNSDPTQAWPGLLQAFSVNEDWSENTITWNNAPLAYENIARTWVGVIPEYVPGPGDEYTWDVSRAVDQAYRNGKPVRLALYSADSPMHSGKYFWTSDVDEWMVVSRPTLIIEWGDRAP